MPARTAILAIVFYAASLPVHSEPLPPDWRRASVQMHALADLGRPDLPTGTDGAFAQPPEVDEIRAGRGPDLHARLLRQIAIYSSLGNREAVESLTAQLRIFGVSAEAINEAVTWANLHHWQPARKISESLADRQHDAAAASGLVR